MLQPQQLQLNIMLFYICVHTTQTWVSWVEIKSATNSYLSEFEFIFLMGLFINHKWDTNFNYLFTNVAVIGLLEKDNFSLIAVNGGYSLGSLVNMESEKYIKVYIKQLAVL